MTESRVRGVVKSQSVDIFGQGAGAGLISYEGFDTADIYCRREVWETVVRLIPVVRFNETVKAEVYFTIRGVLNIHPNEVGP